MAKYKISVAEAMAKPDWITLVAPTGSELAPVSHDENEYEVFKDHPTGKFLVRVPAHVARHLCRNGGFYAHSDQDVRQQ